MSSLPSRFALSALALTAASGLTACNDRQSQPTTTVIITPVATGNSFAIDNTNGNVISFNRKNSTAVVSNLAVQGLASGESIVGIDVRGNTATNNGKLYALVNTGAVYVLDPSTGFVSGRVPLKASAAAPTNTMCTPAVSAYTALSGTSFGLDFNPVPDRLRVVSDTGQNLRINVDTGDVTVDCAINTASPSTSNKPTAVAYTNATAATTAAASTTLFYVDTTTDRLLTTTAPNNGTVTEVGALGVDVTAVNGFDIDAADSNRAYAVMTTATGSRTFLYTIDLGTGTATATLEFCGAGGSSGTPPVCANPGNALRGLALGF